MNSSYEPGLLSPLSQYLQDGGGTQQQQTSMGTPRPGTPRGSHFRLSPDGNLNPGTPGASSTHDHHKFPNSPWSGSEPATPGSGYSRNAVVPSSPYISSYPNTPATPGGGGFYQKPCGIPPSNGNGNNNTTAVPPGSPWTDRSVCTPGPMTPLTPATPMHSTMSDHSGSGGSNGSFGNNGSPTFPTDTSNNNNNNNSNGKNSSMHNAPSLAALLQEVPTDSLLPVPVMNHSVQQNTVQQQQPPQQQLHQPNSVPVQNGNSGNANVALASNLQQISESEINNVVDNNPNLISEFERFFADFMVRRNQENNMNRNQSQQPQPQPPPQQHNNSIPMQHHNMQQPAHLQQQPQPPQLLNTMNSMGMGMANGNPGMMYNGNGMPANNGQQGMMMSNGHGPLMQMNGAGGPIRGNKFIGQNHHHGQHPYMTMGGNANGGGGNGLMMRARQIPGSHLQQPHSNQYGAGPQGMPPHHQQQHHPHQQSMMGGMTTNRPGSQFGLHHQQPSASVYAPPPSGSNGGYVQIQQQQQPPQHNNMNAPSQNYQNVQPHHSHPPQNPGPVHWQSNTQQPQTPQHSQSLNNHGMVNTAGQNGMMTNARAMPQQQQQQPSQPSPYFQTNPVNQVNNEQGLSNGSGGSVLPPTTYPFDLNNGGGPASNNPSLPMTPGTSAMQERLGPRTPQPVPVQSPMSIGMGMPSTPQPNTPHMVGLEDQVSLDLEGPYDGSNISQNTWTKAADKCTRPNAVCEVAKVFFDEIFTDDEVIHCTFSGRGSTKKFNPNKVNFLKKATAWILTRPARPWEFNISTCGDLALSQEDEAGLKGVEKKVFTEYRSRRRGDILKIRGQNGTGPPSASSVS